MAERTEEQKVSQAGIVVKLGGAEYEVAPLVIRDARKWRQKVVGVLSGLSGQPSETRRWKRLLGRVSGLFGKGKGAGNYLESTTDDPESFDKALEYLLVTMQDTIIDLFFEYAKDLPRDVIEATATDAEMATAFAEVVKIAFPLVEAPVRTMAKLYQ